MFDYPTLGEIFTGFPIEAARARLAYIAKEDSRNGAQPFYALYRGVAERAHGNTSRAQEVLTAALRSFRDIDRLARAETLVQLLTLLQDKRRSWWSDFGPQDALSYRAYSKSLFTLSPPQFRLRGIQLPVRLKTSSDSSAISSVVSLLTKYHFVLDDESPFELLIRENTGGQLSLAVRAQNTEVPYAEASGDIAGEKRFQLCTRFVREVFSHQQDPAAEPVPRLQMFERTSTRQQTGTTHE